MRAKAGGGAGGSGGKLRASGVLILANKKEAPGAAAAGPGVAPLVPAFDRMDEYLVGGYLSSAAVVIKAARARRAQQQAEARWEVLSQTIHRLYGHELNLGSDMPRVPFEEFAAKQVAALLPEVTLKVCWPKMKLPEETGEEEDNDNDYYGMSAPEFEDEDAALVATCGARAISRRPAEEDGPTLHVLATPVETAGGAVRCCLVASREGGRSFSRAEVEALAVFAAHVGLCME